jgi:hypothetical protein
MFLFMVHVGGHSMLRLMLVDVRHVGDVLRWGKRNRFEGRRSAIASNKSNVKLARCATLGKAVLPQAVMRLGNINYPRLASSVKTLRRMWQESHDLILFMAMIVSRILQTSPTLKGLSRELAALQKTHRKAGDGAANDGVAVERHKRGGDINPVSQSFFAGNAPKPLGNGLLRWGKSRPIYKTLPPVQVRV